MMFTRFLLALLVAVCGPAAWAQSIVVNTYDAYLASEVTDVVELLGFGRGASPSIVAGAGPVARDPVPLAGAGRETFFDTWNDRGVVPPCEYVFSVVTIDAIGTLQFDVVTFNSIDTAGDLKTVLFTVNAAGTQAVGSGTFTVLHTCPIAHCVYIQVFGTQDIGSLPTDGYGGDTFSFVATPVPEPAQWALLALGLAAIGGAVRRRRA